MYDAVIVGSGMFGSTLARTLTDAGKKVLVVEKRPHTGGMCHTENRQGIVFHSYGPHVFHTNDERIWAYVNKFAGFVPFMTRTKAMAGGKLWSFPINLLTLYQLWGVETPREARRRLDEVRIKIPDPVTIEEWVLATYGEEIYELFFRGYTEKQWGRPASKLPAAIAQRLPVRLTFDDNYFTDRYQGVPEGGYAQLFDRMLDGIEVKLGCDFLGDAAGYLKVAKKVVYSGRIDEFFGYELGELEFRTCRFETKLLDGDYQGNPVINYCDLDTPWTRVVEHKHFTNLRSRKTLITAEYPAACGRGPTPLYPVGDAKNLELLGAYQALAAAIPNVVFAGRLGSFRYFDMCEVIAQAWHLAKTDF